MNILSTEGFNRKIRLTLFRLRHNWLSLCFSTKNPFQQGITSPFLGLKMAEFWKLTHGYHSFSATKTLSNEVWHTILGEPSFFGLKWLYSLFRLKNGWILKIDSPNYFQSIFIIQKNNPRKFHPNWINIHQVISLLLFPAVNPNRAIWLTERIFRLKLKNVFPDMRFSQEVRGA